MSKYLYIAFSIPLVFLPTTILGFIDDVGTRETLRSIDGFQIVIGEFQPNIANGESTIAHIKSDIENKLLLAGIRVLNTSQCIKAPGSPWLYIDLNVTSGVPMFFKINVFVCQKAYLARNRANAYVVSWSTGYTGTIHYIEELNPYVSDAIDNFIESWQSVNLKDMLK